MSISNAVETLVVAGVAPALAVFGAALGITSHYSEPITEYLNRTETAFLRYAQEDSSGDNLGNIRRWSSQIHNAHTYRDSQKRCFNVTGAGAIGWVFSYIAEGMGANIMFTSPFGVPTPFGFKIMAIIAWSVAAYEAIKIIKKFGVRPEEAISEEVETPTEAD